MAAFDKNELVSQKYWKVYKMFDSKTSATLNRQSTPKRWFAVDEELRIALKCLSFIGYCPLDLESLKHGKYKLYSRSFQSLFSAILGLWLVFNWVIYLLAYGAEKAVLVDGRFANFVETTKQRLLDVGTDPSAAEFIGQTLRAAFTLIPIFQINNLFTNWVTVRHLLSLMDGWTRIEEAFAQDLSIMTYFQEHRSLCKKSYWKPYIQFSGSLYMCVSYIVFISMATSNGNYSLESFYTSYDIVFAMFVGIDMSIAVFYSDLKNVKFCRSIREAYELLNYGVIHTLESKILPPITVQRWRKLLIMLRDQTETLSVHVRKPYAADVLQTLIYCTMTLFIAMKFDWSNEFQRGAGFLWVCFALGIVVRLQWKANGAESIFTAEQKLLITLETVDEACLHDDVSIQIQITKNVMTNAPNQIKFSHAMSFRKTISLTILQMVVSYVIVLLQATGAPTND